MAKFEVCCHKWADLSEHGYGVSILNDSKYGFATSGNLMRLSLIRAPKAPDAHADMGMCYYPLFPFVSFLLPFTDNIKGRHHIRYAIFPHQGPLDSRTVRAAFNFNNPMQMLSSSNPSSKASSLFSAIKAIQRDPDHGDEEGNDHTSLILDTVKRGEDDEDVSRGELPKRKGRSLILRVYDSLGGKSRGVIETWLPVKKVWKCNVLEDDEEEIIFKDGKFKLELRAFEIATYRLQL